MRVAATLVALTTVAGLVAGSGAAGAAGGGTVLSGRDERGDVKIYQQVRGASPAVRRSIDIRTFDITRRGGQVRFTAGLKDVLPASATIDQVVYVSILPDPSSRQRWTLDVGMTPQDPRGGYANYIADTAGGSGAGDAFCGGLRVKVSQRKDTVSVAAPRRCLSADPGSVAVTSLTGTYRSDRAAYSLDTLQVPVVAALR